MCCNGNADQINHTGGCAVIDQSIEHGAGNRTALRHGLEQAAYSQVITDHVQYLLFAQPLRAKALVEHTPVKLARRPFEVRECEHLFPYSGIRNNNFKLPGSFEQFGLRNKALKNLACDLPLHNGGHGRGVLDPHLLGNCRHFRAQGHGQITRGYAVLANPGHHIGFFANEANNVAYAPADKGQKNNNGNNAAQPRFNKYSAQVGNHDPMDPQLIINGLC